MYNVQYIQGCSRINVHMPKSNSNLNITIVENYNNDIYKNATSSHMSARESIPWSRFLGLLNHVASCY
jgi:hypothetical protein